MLERQGGGAHHPPIHGVTEFTSKALFVSVTHNTILFNFIQNYILCDRMY